MRALHSKKARLFAGTLLAAASASVGVAIAGITSQTVVTDSSAVRLLSVRSEANDLDSGWHQHSGPAIVQVQEGFLKIYQGGCEPNVVGPGETFVEVPGLPVRGTAKGYVKWTTTFVIPQGVPPAQPLTTDPCA
jgi:hypothetical protein